ncbi:MAG: hypothetical protein QM758_00190 [Armatimonas sp.]
MPETSRKKDTSMDTGSAEEAQADALAQSWALARPARDLWPEIEQRLKVSPISESASAATPLTALVPQQAENPLHEILAELKALRQEVGELRREVAQLRKTERKPEFGAALLPFFTADDRGLPLG